MAAKVKEKTFIFDPSQSSLDYSSIMSLLISLIEKIKKLQGKVVFLEEKRENLFYANKLLNRENEELTRKIIFLQKLSDTLMEKITTLQKEILNLKSEKIP